MQLEFPVENKLFLDLLRKYIGHNDGSTEFLCRFEELTRLLNVEFEPGSFLSYNELTLACVN